MLKHYNDGKGNAESHTVYFDDGPFSIFTEINSGSGASFDEALIDYHKNVKKAMKRLQQIHSTTEPVVEVNKFGVSIDSDHPENRQLYAIKDNKAFAMFQMTHRMYEKICEENTDFTTSTRMISTTKDFNMDFLDEPFFLYLKGKNKMMKGTLVEGSHTLLTTRSDSDMISADEALLTIEPLTDEEEKMWQKKKPLEN